MSETERQRKERIEAERQRRERVEAERRRARRAELETVKKHIPVTGFTSIPNGALYDPELLPVDKVLLVALLSFDWVDRETRRRKHLVWPSQRTLSKSLGVSERAIRDSLAKLEAQGYVRVDRSFGRGHTSRYHFETKALPAKRPKTPTEGSEDDTAATNDDKKRGT